MGKHYGKVLSLALAGALIVGLMPMDVKAAKTPKLSTKKITIEKAEKKVLKVNNTDKKVKWSVKSGKKIVTLSNKKKTSVTVKGKKVGNAVVQAKVGSKKLKCKVVVKKSDSKDDSQATAVPTVQTTTPVATTAAQTTTAPISTVPSVNTAAPATEPTAVPTQAPVGETVQDITIDLTGLTTAFTTSPAKIDFSSQIESRFDLAYFDSMEVTYTTEWSSDDAKTAWSAGKIGLAKNSATLTGWDDGIAHTMDMKADGGVISVDLTGSAVKGTAVGINIQPMDADYGWPAGLSKITITGIVFHASAGAVYPDPNAPAEATPTPLPTYAPSEFTYDGLNTEWIDSSKPMVAFTFDDGPVGTQSTDTSMIIQNALHDAGAHATFFYIGGNIDAEGENEIKQAVSYGFEVGNHSFGWNSLSGSDAEDIKTSVGKTNDILTKLTGYSNFLFRAPNLSISDTMKGYINAPFINCAVDSKDWNNATTDEIIANVKAAKDGDVVLMHVTQKTTAAAVPTLLQYFNEKGYQVVSVSEMFAVKGKKLMTGTAYANAAN